MAGLAAWPSDCSSVLCTSSRKPTRLCQVLVTMCFFYTARVIDTTFTYRGYWLRAGSRPHAKAASQLSVRSFSGAVLVGGGTVWYPS